ncbi:uncharacterized protein LOC143918345 [Arctopsyche grandis]|uniref:uncharacterized protein LOC143918345 n=1 Tax=Arctopsyche grandis TaxID=121162 RepID=UPI00406DA2E7
MATLVGVILSNNRQMNGIQWSRFNSVHHIVFDGDKCIDEQCNRRLSADRTAMVHIPDLNDPSSAQMYNSPHKRGLFQDARLAACSCEVEWKLEILDRNWYPNYLMKATCKPSACFLPGYSCKEKKININILKLKKNGDKSVADLPKDLNDKYIIVLHNLTVGCECSL